MVEETHIGTMNRERTTSSQHSSRRRPCIVAYIGAAITKNQVYNDRAQQSINLAQNSSIRGQYSSDVTGLGCPLPNSPVIQAEPERGRQATEVPEDIQPYCVAVDLNGPTKTHNGFVIGRDEQSADLVISGDMGQVSNMHFALTFNDNYEFIVQDLNSRHGTSVKYDNHTTLTERNCKWIVGGAHFVKDIRQITVEIPHEIEFQISIVQEIKPKCPQFRAKVNRFLKRSPSRRLTANGMDEPHEVQTTAAPTGVASPISQGASVLKRLIGRGGCAEAHLLSDYSTGIQWVEKTPIQGVPFSISDTEVRVLRRIKHKHIIEVLDYKLSPSPVIMLEYVPGGTLLSHLKKRQYFTLAETIAIAKQSTCAVAYIHRHKITHRDISSANIFIQERDADHIFVKLADFGLAKEGSELKSYKGTKEYMPPEIYTLLPSNEDNIEYTDAVDIWSLGVVLAEISFNLPPFRTPREGYTQRWCVDIVSHINQIDTTGPMKSFVIFIQEHMLRLMPRQRSSAAACHDAVSDLQPGSMTNEVWKPCEAPEEWTESDLQRRLPRDRMVNGENFRGSNSLTAPGLRDETGPHNFCSHHLMPYFTPSINQDRNGCNRVSEVREDIIMENDAVDYDKENIGSIGHLSTMVELGSEAQPRWESDSG